MNKVKTKYYALLIIFCFVSIYKICAQQTSKDLSFIINNSFHVEDEFSYYHGSFNNKNPMKTKSQSILAAYNPFSASLKAAMYFYQHVLSEQLSKDCPYQVTCSNFSKLSVEHHGLLLGIIMTSDRLTRCSLFSFLDFQNYQSLDSSGKIPDLLCTY